MVGYESRRKTVARFGFTEDVLVEPPFCIERAKEEIGRGKFGERQNVHFLESCGWELIPYQEKTGLFSFEKGIFRPEAQDDLKLLVADGFLEVPCSWKDCALQETGEVFLQKHVRSGESWEKRLIEDEFGFAGPDVFQIGRKVVGNDEVREDGISAFAGKASLDGFDKSMLGDSKKSHCLSVTKLNRHLDRVAVSKALLTEYSGLFFQFYLPSSPFHLPECIVRLYFSGPSGFCDTFRGLGQYCLSFQGNGEAILHEKVEKVACGSYQWSLKSRFRYSEARRMGGSLHSLLIRPFTEGSSGSFSQKGIVFVTSNEDARSGEGVQALKYLSKVHSGNTYIYYPPGGGSGRFQAATLRIDISRNIRPLFQVSKAVYPLAGVLVDDPFCVPFYPSSENSLRLEWFGQVPGGCELSGKLYRADCEDEEELELVKEGQDYREYKIQFPQNAYYAKFFLKGNSFLSPVLFRYRVVRDGVIRESGESDSFETDCIKEVRIIGAEDDPSHESGDLILAGVDSRLESFLHRGLVPVQVESIGLDSRSILFRGYVSSCSHESTPIFSSFDQEGAGQNLVHLRCHLVGMWHRLAEARVPCRYDWSVDREGCLSGGASLPYKVTDALRTLLNWAGFPEEMIDIPDLPVRFLDRKGFVVEPFAHLGDVVMRLATHYLDGYLLFDPNAGQSGVWQLGFCQEKKGCSVARFSSSFHSSDDRSSKHKAPLGFIQKGSLKSWVRPPEANHLTVTGVGIITLGGSPCRLTQILVNPRSYDFSSKKSVDKSHPDYLGRIVSKSIVDPCLDTKEAVNWSAKRYFDQFCRGKWVCRFCSSLVFVRDGIDGVQVQERLLRYGDLVEIDGVEWKIRNVNPHYRKDVYPTAIYECERVAE